MTTQDTPKTDRPYVLLAGNNPIGSYSTEAVARHSLDLLTNCTPGLHPGYVGSLTVGTEVPNRPDEQGYSGWTNRETWALALHLDNTVESYEYWQDMAAGRLEDAREVAEQVTDGLYQTGEDTRKEATRTLASTLEEEVDHWWDLVAEAVTRTDSAVVEDLWLLFTDVGSNTSSINYREIAGHWVNEAADDGG